MFVVVPYILEPEVEGSGGFEENPARNEAYSVFPLHQFSSQFIIVRHLLLFLPFSQLLHLSALSGSLIKTHGPTSPCLNHYVGRQPDQETRLPRKFLPQFHCRAAINRASELPHPDWSHCQPCPSV